MSHEDQAQALCALDPEAFLAELTTLSCQAGFYVDLGIRGELT